ncbi:ETX/MTX2 family pore-forming toxin [Bacillus cereus]|nr:ETX/MTX2 family pore-forming toxin [Bacillus cereus]
MKGKIIKGTLAVASVAPVFMYCVLTSSGEVNAAQINSTENTIKKELKTDTVISDWKIPIFDATEVVGKNPQVPEEYVQTISYGNIMGYFDVKYHQFSVESDGSPIITNSKNIFVGKTTLTNNTDQEQTLSTNSFEKTISNSVTNATTHGFNFGVASSAEFTIPFVGTTGIEITTEYNFSSEESIEKSEEYKYTATPQEIVVPAHSSVEVIVNLETIKAKGDVKLFAQISGRDNGTFVYENNAYVYDLTFNQIVERASKYEKLKDIAANSDGETINMIGAGKYEAEYGTEFSVTVNPIQRNGDVINEGYTYKVAPKIEKAQ